MSVLKAFGIKSLTFSAGESWQTGESINTRMLTFIDQSTVSSISETFPLQAQEEEENFDLALIASLEIDVVPHIGDSRVSDHLVGQLSKILHKGSLLYKDTVERSGSITPNSHGIENIDIETQYQLGTTGTGSPMPRERFSYWCFDLLFLICANTTQGLSLSFQTWRRR
jgi:hypothetical protein